jgi:hypothetical protein
MLALQLTRAASPVLLLSARHALPGISSMQQVLVCLAQTYMKNAGVVMGRNACLVTVDMDLAMTTHPVLLARP